MSRTILHCDLDACYASIEILHRPELRGKRVAVGGSVENRHGIILAKSYECKPFGLKVGMPVREAMALCPDLTVVPPRHGVYQEFSKLFRRILADYSTQIEPFGLDEAWVDITTIAPKEGEVIAEQIRERVHTELGITVSIGVSYNKIFAKLGSDLNKPNGLTVITEDNYKDVVWPLPASDLLGVGRKMKPKLMRYGINTIGDLANTDAKYLTQWFGKWGLFLHIAANGQDNSPVAHSDGEGIVKSIGNSSTCPRDLENERDCKIVFQNLAESVAERMREAGLMAKTVEISLRDNDLKWITRQETLPAPTHISTELTAAAMTLLRRNYKWDKPLRSIGVRGTNLVPIDETRQLSLYENNIRRDRAEKLEFAIDGIRRRYGHFAIDRAMLLSDEKLGRLNAKETHSRRGHGAEKERIVCESA